MFSTECNGKSLSGVSFDVATIEVADQVQKLQADGFKIMGVRYSWEGMLIDFSKIEDGIMYKTEIRMWHDKD